MSVFKLPGKQMLKPAWEFTTKGLIWRLVPAGRTRLVGEERDPERRNVLFFCIDLNSGRTLWQDLSFDQKWWSGIEAIRDGIMLLHGFVTPDMPEHRGITAVDLERGTVAWALPDLTCKGIKGGRVLAERRGAAGVAVTEVDLHTGEFIGTGRYGQASDSVGTPEPDDGVVVPQPGPYGPEAEEILRTSPQFRSVAAPVECLESLHLLVTVRSESLGTGGQGVGRFRSSLAVLDKRNGKQLFAETLHEGTAAIAPEVVFVQDGVLYFIKNRRTICAVRLPYQAEP